MATVDDLRNGLIEKILSINNKDFLIALNQLIVSNASDSSTYTITEEQRAVLHMSEEDIKNGKLISQDVLDRRNLEWLNEK